MVQERTADIADVMRGAVGRLADALDSGNGVDAALKAWAKDEAFDEAEDAIVDAAVRADLASSLMVEDAKESIDTVQLANEGPELDPSVRAAIDAPWDEALEEYVRRGIVKKTELRSLIASYKQRGREARSLMLDHVQTRVRELLASEIESGGTIGDFTAALRSEEDVLGITTEDAPYLSTVFRTNVQSAYGAGRYRQIKRNAETFPLVQYRTVGDARVRDEHAALDGMVFRVGSPEMERVSPPNGFNCRCTWVPMADAEGHEIAEELPGEYTGSGEFDGPPTARLQT